MLRDEEWREEDRLMLRDEKVYVLKDEKLRAEVIWLHHDILVGEHGGQQKITELVTRNFQWPEVTKEVKKYIERCNTYQKNKNYTKAPAEKLMPNAVPEKPQAYIIVDFITKLPLAQGYSSILVVCSRLTKIAYFVPTMEKTSAEEVVKLFQDNVQKLYSLLESIIIDRGVQFAAEMMKELKNMLEIDTKLSTVYYLQTDGQTERINQDLEQYLRMFIDYRQEQWPDWLVIAEFAYNNKVQTSTKVSLFKANNGRDPHIGFEMRKKGKFEKAEKFVTRMKEVHEKTEAIRGHPRDTLSYQISSISMG